MNEISPVLSPQNTPASVEGFNPSRPMSFEAYLDWQPEGGLTEWVAGEGIQYMPASNAHQRIVNLFIALLSFFVDAKQLGKVFSGPFTMRVSPEGNGREPDVFVVLNSNAGEETEKAFIGAADIVIEVVSTDSAQRDRLEKFDEYEAAGVKEYWVIDPRPNRNRADFYQRDTTGRFYSIPLIEGHIFRSSVLSGFWFNTDWLWDTRPNVVEIYRQITNP
jgi:Uma2 family endonuclease